MINAIGVLVTVPNRKTANKIAKTLLEGKIVSCVSIVSNLDSFYWWKGKIEYSKELLLIMNTLKSKFNLVEQTVRKLHPYEVPEIISFDIAKANKDYIQWIKDSVKL
jgi:periplasmic divalent cation tolerance protein